MRPQLENIARAEQYINNELNATERQAFEKELELNSELAALTENLKDLQKAVFRSELRKKIESNAKGGNGWGKAAILVILLFAIATLVYLFILEPENQMVDENSTGLIETISNTFGAAVSDPKAEQESVEYLSEQQANDTLASANDIPDSLGTQTVFNLSGHKLWVQPDIQTFHFESSDGATIEGKDGMLIIVPTNAFIDSSGKILRGKVEFNLVEALGVEEMVLYKLKTVSDGAPLESGGMFHLEAKMDGKPVLINPKRPLYIEIPTTEKKQGMLAFKGEVDTEGKINWVDPKPLKKYLVELPLDELDFLPPGFETEVKGNMPFLNYKMTSDEVTDSLYYSVRAVREADKRSLPKKWGPTGQSGEYETNVVRCGIDPVSIETIKTSEFDHTFIATKEMEERIALLHQNQNGNLLLQIYVNNLSKNLWVSDSLVALEADIEWKIRFETFAAEKLTNIKDADIYQRRLSNYYAKKRRELKKRHEQLATELASKNKEELEKLLADISSGITATVGAPNSLSPNPNVIPTPNAATSNVYATPWASMGWGNIDRYMKLLNGETVETQILASNRPDNTNVTQWLGAINTYTGLILGQNGMFRALFPKRNNRSANTHVFALAVNGGKYSWAMKHYNPYKNTDVNLKMATTSLSDIKADLRGVDMRFGRISKQLQWKEQQAKQQVIMQIQIRKRYKAWLKERVEIMAVYNEAEREQQEVRKVMEKLRNAAFPCNSSLSAVTEEANPDFFIIVEDMPQFPGGDAALLRFVNDNVRYPETAIATGITGVVYVSYVVDSNGNVTNAQIVRGVDSLLDAEALRVTNLLPSFTPGKQRGQAVPVQFTMPIRFALD